MLRLFRRQVREVFGVEPKMLQVQCLQTGVPEIADGCALIPGLLSGGRGQQALPGIFGDVVLKALQGPQFFDLSD